MMNDAAQRLFETATFEGARLSNFIVTARPEVLSVIVQALKLAIRGTLEVAHPDELSDEDVDSISADVEVWILLQLQGELTKN